MNTRIDARPGAADAPGKFRLRAHRLALALSPLIHRPIVNRQPPGIVLLQEGHRLLPLVRRRLPPAATLAIPVAVLALLGRRVSRGLPLRLSARIACGKAAEPQGKDAGPQEPGKRLIGTAEEVGERTGHCRGAGRVTSARTSRTRYRPQKSGLYRRNAVLALRVLLPIGLVEQAQRGQFIRKGAAQLKLGQAGVAVVIAVPPPGGTVEHGSHLLKLEGGRGQPCHPVGWRSRASPRFLPVAAVGDRNAGRTGWLRAECPDHQPKNKDRGGTQRPAGVPPDDTLRLGPAAGGIEQAGLVLRS